MLIPFYRPKENLMRIIATALALLITFLPVPALAQSPQVELKTSQGVVTLELYPDRAPKTVENFLQYVREGFYNGTVFHRVIPNFMIQGGGFTPDMAQKPTRGPIINEAANGLRNNTGWVAMARTSDPHSASAQFFINVKDNDFLNHPGQSGWGYAVFGRVVGGMDIVNRIAAVPTANRGPHANVPVTPVVIESARVLPAKPAAK
jgi:cyclophilin family peptidyl-prolyl cis-trans isomerase